MMCCEKSLDIGINVLERYPEKVSELNAFFNTLPIGAGIEHNRGFLIASLHKAQSIFGYLPRELQLLIAKKLLLNLSDVYGVISFYSFFSTEPMGKYKIDVCIGTACFVKGADKILKEFEKRLNLKNGETSKDLKYSLGGLRCVGACSLAPVVILNGKVYANVTPDKVSEILNDCQE